MPAINLASLLLRTARVFPDRPALALGSHCTASYRELVMRVGALAGALRDSGLAPGDRVALVMGNCPQYVEALFACWYAGLAAVPINAKLHALELDYIIADCGARLCLVTSERETDVGALVGRCGALSRVVNVAGADYARMLAADPNAMGVYEIFDDALAWLFYTSGTTGRPKGVMLSHSNLMAMTLNYFADVDEVAPSDSILHAAPMSHGSGLYILPHVARGALNAVPESGGFDPDEIFALLRAQKGLRGLTMFAAPTMVRRLVDANRDADTDNIKTIVYGGGPMYVEDAKRAIKRFGYKFAQIYGQGESPMTITALSKYLHRDVSHPRYETRLGSVGIPFTGIRLRIGDANDAPLPPGEVGEVLVRGDTVMLGYWGNPEASDATLRNGWLHTGDMGIRDEAGFLTLKDRSKDVIISGGSNIYPREVEEVLLRHPGVLESSVIGAPDAEWGENVVAFVVAKPGMRVAESELDALCLENIARFKRPRSYRFVDALPKNSTGKVLKTALREKLPEPGG
jgi:long-chain acyl-CoA synthetase